MEFNENGDVSTLHLNGHHHPHKLNVNYRSAVFYPILTKLKSYVSGIKNNNSNIKINNNNNNISAVTDLI